MIRRTAAVLAMGLLLAACGDSKKPSLTLSTRLAAPATAAGALAVGDRVTVERVRMVIRDVKLEQEATETEVESGPYLLDLSGADLAGGVVKQFTVDVPEGTYDELRFVVHKLEDGQTVGDPALDSRQASIVLDLTVDGEAATWTTDVNDTQRLTGTFDVGADGGDNLTLQIDPSGWFTGPSGEFLDPRLSANQQAIEENVRSSIDAFDDDDRDGHDDDGPNHT